MKLWKHVPEFGRAFRYGTTFPSRFVLAIGTTMVAAAMAFDPRFHSSAQYIFFQITLSPYIWALAFVVLASLQWWRIFDTRPRARWATVINCSTFGLWLTFTLCGCLGPGLVPVDYAAEIALTISAGWIAVRTEITQRDRETA